MVEAGGDPLGPPLPVQVPVLQLPQQAGKMLCVVPGSVIQVSSGLLRTASLPERLLALHLLTALLPQSGTSRTVLDFACLVFLPVVVKTLLMSKTLLVKEAKLTCEYW